MFSYCVDSEQCVWVGQGLKAAQFCVYVCVCVCLVIIHMPVCPNSASGCTVHTHPLVHAHTCTLCEETPTSG